MMITLRRAGDRTHVSSPRCNSWRTFDPNDTDDGFRDLGSLDETILHPGMGLEHEGRRTAFESLIYVLEGELTYQDSNGGLVRQGVGEFQRAANGHPRVVNGSMIEDARFLLMSLKAAPKPVEPDLQRKRFLVSERKGILRLIASPIKHPASLLMGQDVQVYSALLDTGNHLVHELAVGRHAWLHVVKGRVTMLDHALLEGDGAALSEEAALSMMGRASSEVLVLDLP